MAGVRRFLIGLALAGLAVAARAAPLEAYGKLPSIETGALSASGDQVAVVLTDGEQRKVLVKDLVHDKVTYMGDAGLTKVRDLRWAGDRDLLITTSVTGVADGLLPVRSEWYFTTMLDLETHKAWPLLERTDRTLNVIAEPPAVRVVGGQPAVFLKTFYVDMLEGMTLTTFSANLKMASARKMEVGEAKAEDFVLGPDGKAVAEAVYDDHTGHWGLRFKSAIGGWREAVSVKAPLDGPSLLGLGHDGKSVIVSWRDGDEVGWREATPEGLGPVTPVLNGQSPIEDPADGRIIGFSALEGDEGRYVFYDPADEKAWKAVVAAFAGDRVELISWSSDRMKILVRVDSDQLGPAYAVVDRATHSAKWLGVEYDGLDGEKLAAVRPLHFKAGDGLDLTGYLTLPPNREAKGLPLVVFPHGGPASRDTPGFDWWAQAMASRGYAVLQINFRGSTGFGREFREAGYGQFGRKMQTDLSDGVAYLAGQGLVDPKRVCIVGASYGGYAALAGVTLQKGVYRCAVSVGGISDLPRMLADRKADYGEFSERYWARWVGARDKNDPILADYSPVKHAFQADAPVLLIHGKDDTVVPLVQSAEMAEALKRAGKPVDLLVLDSTDHWLSRGDTRVQMLKATVAFLEKNNPPN